MESAKTYYLYALRHPVTNELRYIGQTRKEPEARLRSHITSGRKPKPHIKVMWWIMRLLREGLEPTQQVLFKTDSKDEIDRLEIAAIRGLRRRGFSLENVARGGNSHWKGKKLSPEERVDRKRLNAERKAAGIKYVTNGHKPEVIAKTRETKIKNGTLSVKWPEEQRQAQSARVKARWADPEWRQKRVAGKIERAKDPAVRERMRQIALNQSPEVKKLKTRFFCEMAKDKEYVKQRNLRAAETRRKRRKEATQDNDRPDHAGGPERADGAE